jgi:release factor glutamine methyltransferase
MTIQLAYQRLLAELYEVYDNREAENIADMVIEQVTGQRKIERIMYKDLPVGEKQQMELERMAGELLNHRPIQYVLGEAWFMDMKFSLNEYVLIPRPETEELVQWILEDIKPAKKNLSLIDIGTGSGCIPLSVRKKRPGITISAIDVSKDALAVAKANAVALKAAAEFIQINFLNEKEWGQLGKYDIIVSNPPYIKQSEEAEMRDNVLKYEPRIALFVPDDDALLFYKAIAKFSQNHLNADGSIYVEINEALGKEVVELFEKNGFKNTVVKKDMQGKDRMVKTTKA